MPVNVERQVFEITPENGDSAGSIPLSIGMMQGDILVYRGEGDIVRLPVGSAGQVLTADPTSELGVRWATPT